MLRLLITISFCIGLVHAADNPAAPGFNAADSDPKPSPSRRSYGCDGRPRQLGRHALHHMAFFSVSACMCGTNGRGIFALSKAI